MATTKNGYDAMPSSTFPSLASHSLLQTPVVSFALSCHLKRSVFSVESFQGHASLFARTNCKLILLCTILNPTLASSLWWFESFFFCIHQKNLNIFGWSSQWAHTFCWSVLEQSTDQLSVAQSGDSISDCRKVNGNATVFHFYLISLFLLPFCRI